MNKTQHTADQYTAARSSLREKASASAQEAKNKKKSILEALSGVEEPATVEELGRKAKSKITKEFIVKNQDAITEYKQLAKEHRKNEAVFKKLFEEAKKELSPDIDEASLREVMMGKSEKKGNKMESRKAGESAEKMKTPALEKENHKIDANKSKTEKLAQGWKEEEIPAYINGSEIKIKVLKKEIAEGAFVREYQDDGKMPAHLVGEQLFNWKAVLSLGLKDRLPTRENMQTMRGQDHTKFMEDNFKKDDKNLFPGCWNPVSKSFYGVGRRTHCWLADGGSVGLGKDGMGHNGNNPEFGFSLRLLKN